MMFPLLLATAQATAPSPVIRVAQADWDMIAKLETRSGPLPGIAPELATQRIQEIIRRRECDLGVSANRYDLRIRIAVKINAAGKIVELIVEPKDCRPLESLAAAFFLQPQYLRAVRSRGEGEAGSWFAGSVRFQR